MTSAPRAFSAILAPTNDNGTKMHQDSHQYKGHDWAETGVCSWQYKEHFLYYSVLVTQFTLTSANFVHGESFEGKETSRSLLHLS